MGIERHINVSDTEGSEARTSEIDWAEGKELYALLSAPGVQSQREKNVLEAIAEQFDH